MKFINDPILEDDALEINLTPLIDIVFLLLIFFMVSTTFIDSRSLAVDLPKTKQGESLTQHRDLVVTINKSGAIFLGEKQVSIAELETALETQKQEAASLGIVVRADEHVDHGRVVEIMDLANTKGITKIGIATSTKTQS